MALTGRRDAGPLLAPTRAATFVRESLAELGLRIPGLLGERAAYAGLSRNGPWSCGGSFRILPSSDRPVAVSLSRASDHELLPALIEGRVRDAWTDVAAWLRGVSAEEAETRLRLLGLPGGAVATAPPTDRPPALVTELGRRAVSQQPVIIDLTSMWAGPLCAHLLARLGARVIKVETAGRPDGARIGTPGYFKVLHDGHEQKTLELDSQTLADLMAGADLVLESSRPRALTQQGIRAEDYVADGTTWLSITARGRASDAVGFGDDVAACAGLVIEDGGELLPVGDAIADPLSGVAAALAAVAALQSTRSQLIDVSMLHVTADLTIPTPQARVVSTEAGWVVETDGGPIPVEEPRLRGGSASGAG